uniref:EpxF n=1 Tax=Goodfellowiella coeruleoviolacea TaxID=334858 RepID=V5RNC8_9PSEU|nr:EpxF [Goodfellowiella coeruleoviolacea]
MSIPGTTSFLEQLYVGRFRWDLIHPFPRQDEADRRVGDEVIAQLRQLIEDRVDPDVVDREARLPDGLVDELQKHGFLKARLGAEFGGLGLSHMNLFRLIEAAASWSVPVALVMAIENSVGVGPMHAHLPAGPLRDLVEARLRAGTVSGTADTEPAGAANHRRFTTATPTEDGTGYLLNGEKLHVGNAPIAEVLIVSASVVEDGVEHRRMFIVDTDSPGLRITARHEFMGVKGFPNGGMVFDNVFVPNERMVTNPPNDKARVTMEAVAMVIVGRLHMIVAPSLAIARQCLGWSREFVRARSIDGRPLGEYEEIQRRLAESAADVFAIEAIAEWSLLCPHWSDGINPWYEQSAAKNIGSVLGWRVAERTMSLLAGEGYETASSKSARGAARPFPLERALRDVRNFRISGGIDFQLDYWTSTIAIFTYYYPDPDNLAEIEANQVDLDSLVGSGLSERNERHLRHAAEQARKFSRLCRELSQRYPDLAALSEHERKLILIGQLSNELLAVALVLARAARLAGDGQDRAQALADVFCTGAGHRIADIWHQLAEEETPDYRSAAAADGN